MDRGFSPRTKGERESDRPELRSPLGKMVDTKTGNPGTFERYAKQLRKAGGALILPNQMEELAPATKADIEKLQDRAYGKAK